jgi:hypothetical protein
MEQEIEAATVHGSKSKPANEEGSDGWRRSGWEEMARQRRRWGRMR